MHSRLACLHPGYLDLAGIQGSTPATLCHAAGSGRRFQASVFCKISPDSSVFLHQALAGPRGQLLPAAGSDDSSDSVLGLPLPADSVLGLPLPADSVLTAPGAGDEGGNEREEEGEVQQQVAEEAGKSAGGLLWWVVLDVWHNNGG
jgi:hypothetical protein